MGTTIEKNSGSKGLVANLLVASSGVGSGICSIAEDVDEDTIHLPLSHYGAPQCPLSSL
jgi:hypothetical protein